MVRRLFALGSLLVVLGVAVSALPAYAVYRDSAEAARELPAGPASPLTAQSAGATKAAATQPDDGPGVYVVQLADPPVALYSGGVPGLRPTSASATGRAKIDADSAAAQAYVRHLESRERGVLAALQSLLGAAVTPAYSYRYAFNGFAAVFTPEQAAAVASLPGVRRVQRDWISYPQTDRGPAFIGAAQDDQQQAGLLGAILNGGQEVPPVTTVAGGRGVVSYDADSDAISYSVSYEGLSGAPTLAHIHIGAPGVAGGVVLDIFDTAVGAPGTSGAFIGTKTLADVGAPVNQTAAQIEAALLAGDLYFNIHTPANPSGEIRGQITPSRGEGMLVGIIDSGIDPTNPSFADVGDDGYDHTNPLGAGNYVGVCSNTDDDDRFDATFPCNDKLIGAYTFDSTAVAPDPQGGPSPRDDDGHGSHTAGTTAGNVVNATTVNGISTGAISGVAPHANLIIYDTCGTATSAGCPGAALVAAIDQATANAVDVINYSIGGDSRDPWFSPDSLSFLAALDAGVFAAVSAGNDGPGAETIGAPSNSPWVTSVAASTHDRIFVNSLQNFSGGDAGTRPTAIDGKGATGGLPATSLIYAGDLDNELCGPFTPAQEAEVTGKIVVCDRGTFGRVEKAQNVADAGGVGYVLINDAANGPSLTGDAFPIPGVHISFADGEALKAWLTGCANCQASISGASRQIAPAYGDIMASFSSRGPDLTALNVLKPDVAAPGVDILAPNTNVDAANPDYQFLSGTSMASPHVAGAAALLRQLHPDWTPAEVKSALMTTAVTSLLKEDEATPADPYDFGGGRIDVARAARAGLVFDENADVMLAADPFFEGDPTTLNFANAANDVCIVTCTFTRTVRSTLGASLEWTASTTTPTSMTLSVEPASFTLAPGATQTLTITADVEAAALDAGYVFGTVTLTSDVAEVPAASVPVAIQPSASDLPGRITIDTATTEGSIVEPIRSIAVTDFTADVFGLVRATPTAASIPQDPTPDDPIDGPEGTISTTVTLPATTTRFHASLADSTAPDLDLFVYLDGLDAADGVPQADELFCVSATGGSDEFCDITTGGGTFGIAATFIVVVQNWEASEADTDSFTLYTGAVGNTAAGNLTVSAPETNPGGEAFDLTLAYDLEGAADGDLYIGLIRLGTAPAADGDLGFTLVNVFFDEFNLFVPLAAR